MTFEHVTSPRPAWHEDELVRWRRALKRLPITAKWRCGDWSVERTGGGTAVLRYGWAEPVIITTTSWASATVTILDKRFQTGRVCTRCHQRPPLHNRSMCEVCRRESLARSERKRRIGA